MTGVVIFDSQCSGAAAGCRERFERYRSTCGQDLRVWSSEAGPVWDAQSVLEWAVRTEGARIVLWDAAGSVPPKELVRLTEALEAGSWRAGIGSDDRGLARGLSFAGSVLLRVRRVVRRMLGLRAESQPLCLLVPAAVLVAVADRLRGLNLETWMAVLLAEAGRTQSNIEEKTVMWSKEVRR